MGPYRRYTTVHQVQRPPLAWCLPKRRSRAPWQRRGSGSNTQKRTSGHFIDDAPSGQRPHKSHRALFTPPERAARPTDVHAAVRHEAEYFVSIEHHNPMSSCIAVIFDQRQTHGIRQTQGVQTVPEDLCGVSA